MKKKILIAANACECEGYDCAGMMDMSLPITAWAEREGTYTSAFGGAKLALHMGPVPPKNSRSLRWVLSEALRRLGTEIASSEMAEV